MFTKQVSRPVGSLDPQIVAPRPSRSNNSRKDLFTGRFEVFVPFRSEVDRAADVRGWLSRVRTGTPPKQRLLASTGDHLGHQATSQPVAALSCMTAATDWPRIGPATHCAMTQEDEWRREANPQVDDHLMATPQVAESPSGTLSRWRHGFKSRWDYLTLRCANQRRNVGGRRDLLPAHHTEFLHQEPDERLLLLRRGALEEQLDVSGPLGDVVGRRSH